MPGALRKEKATDDSHPFGMPWLDSCYQETLLPTGPWLKVCTRINDALAKRIEKQFNYLERKQMIFELIGVDFIKHYFPKEDYNPMLIEPPHMNAETKRKLQIDAQNWLQGALTKVASETGCQRHSVAEEHGEQNCTDCEDFLAHTKLLLTKGMDRHLLLQEKEIQKKWEDIQWEKTKAEETSREARDLARDRMRLQRERDRLYGDVTTVGLRSILKKGDSQSDTRLSTAVSTPGSRPVTANVKGALFGTSVDPPVFWGMQSNSLGRSLIAVLKRDPRRMTEVTSKLHGRQLPGGLRQYIWTDVLLKHERNQFQDVNIESMVRERFVKSVKRGISQLNIKKATHSPISGLIDNAVVEIFEKTPGMGMYKDDDRYMKECAKALNILYVYDRSYEPYLIHWIFPLQICYEDDMGEGEHVYELAMYLDLLNKTLFPKWPEIFATAEKVMQRLKAEDAPFYEHLKTVANIDATINPKDFLVQLIHQEKNEAEILLQQSFSGTDAPSASLLADPLIFLRKWVGEGFAGVLDTQAAVFIWDQNFLQKWHLKVMEDACLALLMLLKHKFMRARDYSGMKEVFLKGPALLYTLDIQKAWVHIQLKGVLPEVPYMNRLRPRTRDSSPVDRRHSPTPSATSIMPLEPLAISNLRLTLVVPGESVQKERWLADLQMSEIALECLVYFGDIKITEKRTKSSPVIVDAAKDKYGGVTYRIEYKQEEFRFLDLDLGAFDVEMEMGGYPYAIVEVKYSTPHKESVTLGWARIKLYQHRSELEEEGKTVPGSQQWSLLTGDYFYTIYGGPSLEKFGGEARTPQYTGNDSPGRHSVNTLYLDRFADLLGNNCQLGAFIHNPSGGARSPPRPRSRRVTPVPSKPLRRKSPTPVPPPDVRPPPKTDTPMPRTPKDLTVTDEFDMYVDTVTNIPDNASIVKVTGRVVKTGEIEALKDLQVLPEISSSARNPRFKHQYNINKAKVKADANMIVLLRLYTVDIDTQDLVVIGSTFFEVFDRKQILKQGNHIRQLHCGMPNLTDGVKSLNHNSLDKGERIPACQIYFRIERPSTTYRNAPNKLDSYKLDDSPLNGTEKLIAESYRKDGKYPATVQDAVIKLQGLEHITEQAKVMDNLVWLQQRLDQKRHLPPNQPAENLDLNRLVRYRQGVGFTVNIHSAYGLPGGLYMQCYATVQPGKDAAHLSPTSEGYGRPEHLRTAVHDWNAPQRAPKWLDKSQKWHPHLDQHTVILVQIFAYDVKYVPSKKNTEPGKLTNTKGQPLTVSQFDLAGWAVVPLFEKDYVLMGRHHVPVFKGKPSKQILDYFTQDLAENILSSKPWAKESKLDGAALVVDVLDGHFKAGEIPGGLQTTDFLLDSMGNRNLYTKAENDTAGAKMNELVIKHLPQQFQKTTSETYKKEQRFFEQVTAQAYAAAVDAALSSTGKVGVV